MIDVQKLASDIEAACRRAMADGNIPSATVAVVEDDKVIWTWADGVSNIRGQTQVDLETVYLIGSTFKAMSTLALLKLMEEGKFGLDDAVSGCLDFELSGDNERDPGYVSTSLDTYVRCYGRPWFGTGLERQGTANFRPVCSFGITGQGSASNKGRVFGRGFALIGYLVQKLSGVEFKQYIHRHIFEPLEMASTVFEPTPEIEERMSVPYVVDQDSGRQVPVQRVKLAVYPAGVVYGTVSDQANWLIFNLNNGVFKGN